MQPVDLTKAISDFAVWFNNISLLLFDNIKLKFDGWTISLGGLIVSFILISFVISVFWKGTNS